MIKQIVHKIVGYQIKNGIIVEGERALYEYSYTLLLENTINLFCAAIIAVIFHDFMTVCLFCIVYALLRVFAGGYHARTGMACTCLSVLVLILVCIMIRLFRNMLAVFFYAGECISFSIIWRLAPLADVNKPFVDDEEDRYRKKARSILVTEIIMEVLFMYMGWNHAALVVWYAHLVIGGALVKAKADKLSEDSQISDKGCA